MSSITNKNQINWLDNICAKSRNKFIASESESKVHTKLSDDLISAKECYSFIKRNWKRSVNEGEDILWKIPVILIILGCILILLMALSFVFQCLLRRLRDSSISEQFSSDICDLEEEPKIKRSANQKQISEPKKKAKRKCGSCFRAK